MVFTLSIGWLLGRVGSIFSSPFSLRTTAEDCSLWTLMSVNTLAVKTLLSVNKICVCTHVIRCEVCVVLYMYSCTKYK